MGLAVFSIGPASSYNGSQYSSELVPRDFPQRVERDQSVTVVTHTRKGTE
jgi:hypothetical protein